MRSFGHPVCKCNCRLSKETVMQLCINLMPHMPQGRNSTAIPSELKVILSNKYLNKHRKSYVDVNANIQNSHLKKI